MIHGMNMGCYDDTFCRMVRLLEVRQRLATRDSEPIFTAAHIKISLQYRHGMQLNNNIHNDRNNGGGDDTLKNQRLP